MARTHRALSLLCCVALVFASLPIDAVAAEIEAPLGGGARAPGEVPLVSGPRLPEDPFAGLPTTQIPESGLTGAELAKLTGGQAALPATTAVGKTAEAANTLRIVAGAGFAAAEVPNVHRRAVGFVYNAHRAGHEARFHIGGGGRIAEHLREFNAWGAKTTSDDDVTAPEEPASPFLGRGVLGPALKSVVDERGDFSKEPAEPKAPRPGKPKAGWFGLGAAAAMFIGALAVQQIGIESQVAAMPALLQKTFGDFSVVADITIIASLGSIVGRIIGPIVVNKFSLKTAYIGSLGAKLVVSALMAGLLAVPHLMVLGHVVRLTVPGLAFLYGVSGLLSGVSMTAEKAIGPALLGQDQEKLERFGAGKQVVLETIGSVLPIATGALVAHFGFIPALVAFPVAFGASILLLAKFLKIPEKIEAIRKMTLAADETSSKKTGAAAQFGEFFKKIGHGARVVWSSPALKYAFLAYTAFMVLNPFLYTVLAPAYGVLIAGAHEAQQAALYTMLTGLYSAGGLLGGVLMLFEQRRLKKLPAAEVPEKLRKSMLRWMMLGTVALAAIATLALPLHPLFASVTLPALALFPYGVAQVIANIKQENYFVSKVPEKDVNDAIGFMGAASLAISTIGLVGLKFLFTGKLPFGFHPFAFSGLHGFAPFIGIAVAMIPLALYYVFLTRKLDHVSRAASTPPPRQPPAPPQA